MERLILSSLDHTWIFDLDGTIVKHNGYKIDGHDTLLNGIKMLWETIPKEDAIIILTSRSKEYSSITEEFLFKNNIRYDYIIYGLPYGERIIVNDNKPSNLKMCYAICKKRDEQCNMEVIIDRNI